MKTKLENYPLDIILCLLVSLILIPLVLFNIQPTLRLILGLPFILFIPGYILVFALFPARKTDRGIDTLERIALSFGLSIAIVPLIGLLLNYTPWGIRLEPILISNLIFIISIGLYGIYRWNKTDPEERYIIPLKKITLPKQEKPIDRILTIILIITILLVIISLIYVITIPKTGEQFSELYILGPTGKAEGYPHNLTTQENATITIGLANHENQPINYTIQIWLINQTTLINNQTIYNQMYILDTITTTLPHQPINIEETWQPQWTTNYTIHINTTGTFKLAFLLYKNPTTTYNTYTNYQEIADQIINSAYLENHIWITIK
jgi:uncharacterized membrane protein